MAAIIRISFYVFAILTFCTGILTVLSLSDSGFGALSTLSILPVFIYSLFLLAVAEIVGLLGEIRDSLVHKSQSTDKVGSLNQKREITIEESDGPTLRA